MLESAVEKRKGQEPKGNAAEMTNNRVGREAEATTAYEVQQNSTSNLVICELC